MKTIDSNGVDRAWVVGGAASIAWLWSLAYALAMFSGSTPFSWLALLIFAYVCLQSAPALGYVPGLLSPYAFMALCALVLLPHVPFKLLALAVCSLACAWGCRRTGFASLSRAWAMVAAWTGADLLSWLSKSVGLTLDVLTYPFTRWVAWGLRTVFHQPVAVLGNTLNVDGFSTVIIGSCLGLRDAFQIVLAYWILATLQPGVGKGSWRAATLLVVVFALCNWVRIMLNSLSHTTYDWVHGPMGLTVFDTLMISMIWVPISWAMRRGHGR